MKRLIHDSAYSGMVAALALLERPENKERLHQVLYEVFVAAIEIYELSATHERKRLLALPTTIEETHHELRTDD